MQAGQKDDADNRGSQGPDPGDSCSTPQPSSKLRDKLQKLTEWRIDSSSIEFPGDGPEFRGGFATVSRAFLVSTSASKSSADDSAQTGGENESDGGAPKRKAIAVKKLKIENGKDKERVLGLALREAGFLTELSHQNVIKLEGFVEDLSDDRVWLVFPWAANGNLKDFVASADWEIPERIWLIDDVARGVEYLHTQNPPICHGDLKSANVVVNSEYRAAITDFGSARRITKKDPPVKPEKSEKEAQPALLLETEFSEATSTMTLKGNQFTLRWAAPELLMEDEPGMEPGLWSDIWALGWIFYEVLTNSIPFQNVKKDSVVIIHVIQGNLPSAADHASMPMIVPDPQRTSNMSSQVRSPELLIKLGDMHRSQSDYINASKFYTEALGICTESSANGGKAKALLGLATTQMLQDKYNEAATLYSEAAQICTDICDSKGRAQALWGLAEVHGLQSEYSKSVPLYSEVIQIYANMGNREGGIDALWGLAETHRMQGEFSKAIPLFSEVVQISTKIGERRKRADALRGLAHIHRVQNEYSQAIPLYSEVAQIFTDIGDRQGRANALRGLAEVHRLQKQYNQAIQLFSEALQIHTDIGDRYGRAGDLLYLAGVHRDQDQHEDAISLYEQSAGILQEIGNTELAEEGLRRAADSRRKLKPVEAE